MGVSRRALSILLLTIVALALTSCGPRNGDAVASPRAQQIRVGGAFVATELIRHLAAVYPQSDEVEFVFQPDLYTAGGVQGTGFGDFDVGGVARELTESERASGLEFTPLANDGLAIAVNPTAKIRSLTSEQVRDLYAGRYENWREIGGADMPILILDRGEDLSAKMALRTFIIGSAQVTSGAVPLYKEEDMIEGLQSTPGALGFMSLGYVLSERSAITVVDLDGVRPSVESVRSGAYRPRRTIGVVIRPDADERVREFVEWTSGPEAARLMEKKGFAAVRSAKN